MSREFVEDWIKKTIAIEGGYVNDKVDPGGETKYGISKRSFPDIDIKNLTEDQAVAIYREQYWKWVDRKDLSMQMKWKLFDMGVNMGTETAQAIWERVQMAGTGKDWSIDKWMHEISAAQMKHYAKIIGRNVKMVKYLPGWTNRAMEIG